MDNETTAISLRVNGAAVRADTDPRRSLADFLRQDLELTGTHVGCEHGVCGACTVRLDGRIIRGCLLLAVQADGGSVETIEGMNDDPLMQRLQERFVAGNALQCGFCTSGMLLTAYELIATTGATDRQSIRAYISGNYCRCTGYQAIVEAIHDAAVDEWRDGGPS